LHFIDKLSRVKADLIPRGWINILKNTRGIYLLTCPLTREQYVGSAIGKAGFLGRWRQHAKTGYGDAVKLKSREMSDYQVSILEVVGTSTTDKQIIDLEIRWKEKLQTKQMGLNGN
jgi:GIY-YIG catalytic domain